MPARRYYVEIDGKKTRVPSVTGVIKNLGGSERGLMYWANQKGLEGLTLDEASSQATSVGTVAHAMIEAASKGEPLDLDGIDEETKVGAAKAFEQWREWADLVGYKAVVNEVSLTDPELRYGGTFDAVMVTNRLCLVDWKTSNALYKEHLIQAAAYGALWSLHNPDKPLERYVLLRLGKHRPSFTHMQFDAASPDMAEAWLMFTKLREIHDLSRSLDKAVK